MVTDIEIRTEDGVSLAARSFGPEGRARGSVLLVPAMGVTQRFYEKFAQWLATEGFHTLTFDYRGVGKSKHGSLADVDADIVKWAEKDTAAAVETLYALAGSLPFTWIGHSLGGQIVPFVPNHERAKKVITIASGSGYWRDNAPELRRKVWVFWWGAVPLATPLFGYFPGKRLGMVGDLPKGVVYQWRKWCMDPEYAAGAEGPAVRKLFADVKTPITSLSFTDDEMMSSKSINVIHGLFTGAPKAMKRFAPRELGLERVGHFGFFRPEMEQPIWKTHVMSELAV